MARTKPYHNKIFLRELARLNHSQQRAVEHIEGPVLVVAGPGTGKTQILTARIGKILLDTDAQPHNILCLTFTDAGVRAMRQRLQTFIGPAAHRVHIFTFHSFCNKVIQENLEYFGRQDIEPISELERIELLRQLLLDLPLDHPLKQGRTSDILYYMPHLKELFARMKREGWSPAFIHRQVKIYLEDLPRRKAYRYQRNGRDFNKGDLKTTQIEAETYKMRILVAAADLYPLYQKRMDKNNRYDYDDMILWVLAAFRDNPMLLRNYQEQYLYFLVDEFQDTNGTQNEILNQLTAYWDVPNIFIVGDDDQSIYEFQGARLKNITDFFEKHRDHLKLVVLNKNYRSTQNLLNAAQSLIAKNQIRLARRLSDIGIEKPLVAENKAIAQLPAKPEITAYPNPLHEITGIVTKIEKLLNSGIAAGEIAVIYAEHKQADDLKELLLKKQIPFNTKRRADILHTSIVQQVWIILKYIAEEMRTPRAGTHLLFKILHFDFLKIHQQDIARLSLHLQKEENEKLHWNDLISDKAALKTCLNAESASRIHRVGQIFSDLIHIAWNNSLLHLVESLYHKTGLLQSALTAPQDISRITASYTFLEFVKSEVRRHPMIALPDLLNTLELLKNHRLPIPMQTVIDGASGIQLMTAHSAKGLEFEYVFMLDVTDTWEPRTRNSSFRFTYPDTLTLSGEEDALEARRRLFYVSVTRAKKGLYISYSEQNNKNKDRQRALFIEELLATPQVHFKKSTLARSALIQAVQVILSQTSRPMIKPPGKSAIDALLSDFTMSISALNRYLNCPLAFYYEYILKIPSAPSEQASYGAAIHKALQVFFEEMLKTKSKKFPPKAHLISLFDKEMQRYRGYFGEAAFERKRHRGRQHLAQFYDKNHSGWNKNVKIEYYIYKATIAGVPATGTIDKIEFREKSRVTIVDYKTGKPIAAKLRRPTKSKPQGGSYWRQLVFYKLLFENYKNTPYRVDTARLSYLTPDKQGLIHQAELKFVPEDTARLQDLLKAAYAAIMRQEFYDGCGEYNCSWCRFLKDHTDIETFTNKEIEALDDPNP